MTVARFRHHEILSRYSLIWANILCVVHDIFEDHFVVAARFRYEFLCQTSGIEANVFRVIYEFRGLIM